MNTTFQRARLLALADRAVEFFPPVGIELKQSSVLLLVWEDSDRLWLALTERAARLRSHGGDIALPGGRIEPGESAVAAALRETHEEVGVDPASVEVVGRLDDAWSGLGFHINPIVAWSDSVPRFRPDPSEVARVVAVSVDELSDPANQDVQVVPFPGFTYRDDIIHCSDAKVVGATADIVADLCAWLGGSDRRRVADRYQGLRYMIDTGRIR